MKCGRREVGLLCALSLQRFSLSPLRKAPTARAVGPKRGADGIVLNFHGRISLRFKMFLSSGCPKQREAYERWREEGLSAVGWKLRLSLFLRFHHRGRTAASSPEALISSLCESVWGEDSLMEFQACVSQTESVFLP